MTPEQLAEGERLLAMREHAFRLEDYNEKLRGCRGEEAANLRSASAKARRDVEYWALNNLAALFAHIREQDARLVEVTRERDSWKRAADQLSDEADANEKDAARLRELIALWKSAPQEDDDPILCPASAVLNEWIAKWDAAILAAAGNEP